MEKATRQNKHEKEARIIPRTETFKLGWPAGQHKELSQIVHAKDRQTDRPDAAAASEGIGLDSIVSRLDYSTLQAVCDSFAALTLTLLNNWIRAQNNILKYILKVCILPYTKKCGNPHRHKES